MRERLFSIDPLTPSHRAGEKAPNGLPRHPSFFINRDDKSRQRRFVGADLPSLLGRDPDGGGIAIWIEFKPAPCHASTDPSPYLWRLLPDSAAENHCVSPTQHGKVCPKIVASSVAEEFKGQFGTHVMTLLGGSQQLPHIVGETGYTQKS